MSFATIYDMIQLTGVPGAGDVLTTAGGDMTGVSEPIVFGVGVEGELNLGDFATIGGVQYTISDWDGLAVSYTHSDGAGGTTSTDVNTVRLTLTDSAGNELYFMIPTDGAGDLPDITDAEIISTGTNPDGNTSGWNQQLEGNQLVTLATIGGPDYIVEGTADDDVIDIAYTGDPEGDMVDNNDNSAGNNDDVIEAYGGDDTVYAGLGDDHVDAGTGDDVVHGDGGNDTLLGMEGDDTLFGGSGDDHIEGGVGDDYIEGGDGADTVLGGDGDDIIDTSGAAPASDYGWPAGGIAPDGDVFDDRDTVYGGAGDDTIATGDDQDFIVGGDGDDIIDGGLDDDTITGDAGDDTIIGGHGSDTIDGGDGDDVIYGGMGPGTDPFNIPDVDQPGDAFPFADPVTDNGIDVIHGGAGDDVIYGQDDADELYGDEGDDFIDGGIDDDLIDGGAGDDVLLGGADADTFVNLNAGDSVDGGADGVDHDILDLTGSAPTGGTLEVTLTGPDSNGNGYDGYVTYYDDLGNVTGTLDFEEIEEIIPCFTPGTMIATPRGERAVESLREGDKVITRDNGIQEIRWAGTKKMGWQDFASAEHLKPILIREGALGNGLPERDILVSPNHRVLVANDRTALYFEEREVLVAAKHLVDNKGVMKVDTMSTAYIHFMFDHHEVVLSNGAWTESFQPGDYSLKGIGNAQRAEIFELFPELEQQEGVRQYAAARRTLKKHEARILLK